MGWSHQMNPYMKASISNVYQTMVMLDDKETEVVQSKERRAYVKVNMEGIVLLVVKYASMNMPVSQDLPFNLRTCSVDTSCFGLRLFDSESEFSLFYKDSTESWRTVGDVPW
ncbi:hypothetical protein C5167_020368, partial [Papaver somniferum]